MTILYQIATVLALVLAGPFLLLSRGRHYLATLPGRMGRYSGQIPESPVWIHAVSVGEVVVANTLVQSLPIDLPLLVTTVTPTGQERARALFGERAAVAYLPFDLTPFVERFLIRFSPRALILVEGDLWPLVLAKARQREIPIAVINGRISDRSFRRMSRLKSMLGPLLDPVGRFGTQSEIDRQRLIDLGVDPQRIEVTGNLKFETPAPKSKPDLLKTISALAAGRPILVAGSTMPGEEDLVMQAFCSVGGGTRALLVLAPRHPERWNEVEALVSKYVDSMVRRSELDDRVQPADVLLLDSLGELAAIYEIGLGCFVGGTLVPTGGHNPLEPAIHGVAISVGPSMENFREIAEAFDRADAWSQVDDVTALGTVWESWLSQPDLAAEIGSRGLRVVAANQGSLVKTIEFLAPIIQGPSQESQPTVADLS